MRDYSWVDRILAEAEHMIRTLQAEGPSFRPLEAPEATELPPHQKKHVGSLVRVNHTGEICAQALYRGQAFMAASESTREHLLEASEEEWDHLIWCQLRLDELDSRPSYLRAFWYSASWLLGMASACLGDRFSLGFVIETEAQVERHLQDHLEKLPDEDHRSRALFSTMQEEESEHRRQAEAQGGMPLPYPVQACMHAMSRLMVISTRWI